MSLGYTISSKHHIGHGLRATDLLSKIHWLNRRCLILKADLHMTLLDSCNLMILLRVCGKTNCPVQPLLAFIGTRPIDGW
jgi:hypothetical protein